ncbi:MAG: Flp pilus assembly protein CpaB [Desulfovibrionaceae bacterium]
MGKTRTIIQLGAALTLALLAGFLVFRFMGAPQRAAQAPVARPEVSVLVAARDLQRGTRMLPDMVRKAAFLKESLPQQYFTTIEEVEGRYLSAPLHANEPVTEARLAPLDAAAAGISTLIAAGHRAFTVKGNEVLGQAGFIRPGNRVDVLVTLEVERRDRVEGSGVQTKTVLENVLVLATGTELADDGDGKPAPVGTYTLELSPAEGETLSLAATRGTLHFALRNPQDTGTVLTSGATIASTLAALKPSARPRTAKRGAPAPQPHMVQVIVGSQTKTMKF